MKRVILTDSGGKSLTLRTAADIDSHSAKEWLWLTDFQRRRIEAYFGDETAYTTNVEVVEAPTEQAGVDLRKIARKKLTETKLRQADLAKAIGISKAGLNNYLQGRQNLTYEQVERLLQVFDLIKE